ncbi:uncharacterized protein NECHADRAFT_83698 [Fusarium vanettenii 77-13-4]|uniref:Uncharacterized protein n=1 Tax=Fusarium vanettenii (strain ATCC MYA-4622 / CBS 123669 / FGSC 9596 / NRRL 45880 / 77-13-4) TaxID=660122 RepID=C7YYI1_FUSV7|nr:uncharacterized protein NECHADRAFT_83698 [Fusarium vanettenii 77-13-4]EEU43193.1 hypothetical protein NECHADRAFT_83698 [Fusarium vanettenii 77-13-4]
MKWYSLLSASFLLGTVIAADPVHQVPEPITYRLIVTANGTIKDIDDIYLSSDEEGTVGIFGTDREPILIHDTKPGKKSGQFYFDTRPGDELFHGLTLLRWQGVMNLKDTLHPHRFRIRNDTGTQYLPDRYSWNEFWFTEGENGMKELFWGAKGDHPGWVAVPLIDATYIIKWYDETSSYMVAKPWEPVKIYLQPFEL